MGAGAPLIILHGLFGASDNWLSIGKRLSENYKIYLLDQRNHGNSFHSDSFTYDDLANDLLQFINSKSLKTPIIIGHSMGGKAAMKLAVKNAAMIKKLIVVDIAPKYYPVHHQHIIDALKSIDLKKIKSRSDADEALAVHFDNKVLRQFLLKNLSRESDDYSWKINIPAIEENLENIGEGLEKGETYDGKALFINGTLSDYVTEDDFPLIKTHFPSVIIKSISAGHWVHAEKPEEFLKLIYEFLSK